MSFLSTTKATILSAIFMTIMFIIVMFIINPIIDNSNGLEVIKLQLLFNKEKAISLVSNWNIDAFKKWIFTDYIYAISYTLFFSSLILWLSKKRQTNRYKIGVYIAIFAGICDMIEDTLEIYFFNNMSEFSNTLFIIHSTISTLKWLSLPIVILIIVKLLKKS